MERGMGDDDNNDSNPYSTKRGLSVDMGGGKKRSLKSGKNSTPVGNRKPSTVAVNNSTGGRDSLDSSCGSPTIEMLEMSRASCHSSLNNLIQPNLNNVWTALLTDGRKGDRSVIVWWWKEGDVGGMDPLLQVHWLTISWFRGYGYLSTLYKNTKILTHIGQSQMIIQFWINNNHFLNKKKQHTLSFCVVSVQWYHDSFVRTPVIFSYLFLCQLIHAKSLLQRWLLHRLVLPLGQHVHIM